MSKYLIILLSGLIAAFLSITSRADMIYPTLHQIMYQTSVEDWVNTQTAEVVISVNASLNENQLAKAHNDILNKLNRIAKSDWHITQFDRTPNNSGLEQLSILAQSSLSEDALSDLREQAKKLSQPGETFKVESITYQPTLAETAAVKKQLRDKIYHNLQIELDNINKLYTNQHYVVHSVSFIDDPSSQPNPLPRLKTVMLAASQDANAGVSPVSIDNKVSLTASIVLVSIDTFPNKTDKK